MQDFLTQLNNPPADFDEYLDQFAEGIGEVVNSYLFSSDTPDIDRFLYEPLLEYSQNGGKRHRPLICIAACLAVGGDLRMALSSAAAVEHFHTAALIHDDIEDEAETRRGEPCLHKRQGIPLAINTGDLALSLVNTTVLTDPLLTDAQKVRIVSELCNMARKTIEGQALDIGWARDGRYDLTEDDYFTMATRKTAHYSGAVPLAIGAMAGGGSEAQIQALRQYGLNTGLAFQIQDDLLNLIGRAESVKKDFRSDITEGKRTLMVVHALRNGDEARRAELMDILSSHETHPGHLARAVQIMEETGSIGYARVYAETLTAASKRQLVLALPPSQARNVLVSMGDWFVRRLS